MTKNSGRDLAIAAAVFNGVAIAAMAEKHNLSSARVRDVVNKTVRRLSHPKRLGHTPWPEGGGLKFVRANSAFLLERLELLRAELETPTPKLRSVGEPDFDAILSLPIEKLSLKTNTKNYLLGGKLRYVGELVQLTPEQLDHTKYNLGRWSTTKVKEALAELHLGLGMDVGNWTPPKE